MARTRIIVAAALAALLACSASANAASRDQTALDIAWTYWNQHASVQVADIQVSCNSVAVEIHWVDYYPAGGVAGASVNGCRTGSPYIRAQNNLQNSKWLRFCRIVTHEYGHLVGFLHTEDTKNIMAGLDGWWGYVPSAATTSRAERLCRQLG